MVGLGETYLPAFALALGHGEVAAGLLSTAPFLVGAALQLLTPGGVRWLGSHRRWLVTCAWLQAAAFLPLIAAAPLGWLPLEAIFAAAVLYWAAGLSAGAAWNSWMVPLIPSKIRPRFFARRAQLVQGSLALSLAGGGAPVIEGFGLLFALAFVARGISARFLSLQSDIPPEPDDDGIYRASRLLRSLRHGPAGRLFVYLISLQLAVYIAAPYFTPFMLQRLELSYAGFVTLTAAAFVSRILFMPVIGVLARQHGARRLLALSGIAVVPLSAMWVVSSSFPYLLLLQIVAGVAWGTYELAVLLLFFETLDGRDRLALLALFNVANAGAMVAGSLVGGLMLSVLGAHPLAYAAVFLASSLLRPLTLFLLRAVSDVTVHRSPIPTRIAAVRPSVGAILPPVVAAISRPDDNGPEPDGPEKE
jgi:hypothetical protein